MEWIFRMRTALLAALVVVAVAAVTAQYGGGGTASGNFAIHGYLYVVH